MSANAPQHSSGSGDNAAGQPFDRDFWEQRHRAWSDQDYQHGREPSPFVVETAGRSLRGTKLPGTGESEREQLALRAQEERGRARQATLRSRA